MGNVVHRNLARRCQGDSSAANRQFGLGPSASRPSFPELTPVLALIFIEAGQSVCGCTSAKRCRARFGAGNESLPTTPREVVSRPPNTTGILPKRMSDCRRRRNENEGGEEDEEAKRKKLARFRSSPKLGAQWKPAPRRLLFFFSHLRLSPLPFSPSRLLLSRQ